MRKFLKNKFCPYCGKQSIASGSSYNYYCENPKCTGPPGVLLPGIDF